MKLEFDSFPLDVYEKEGSKSLLESIGESVPDTNLSNVSLSKTILSSFVRRASGVGLLSLIDSISIELKGDKARKCLSDLAREQIRRINGNASAISEEAQINLMITSCVMDYLSSLESKSWSNGAQNIAKSLIGILSLKNPLKVIWESVMEVIDKYNDICQVYYVAFLLNVYDTYPNTKDTIKKFIIEALCKDSEGESSFDVKKRPLLFSNTTYQTLEDNLANRLDILSREIKRDSRLNDPFIKYRKELNEEQLKQA